jgi:hypothetical protein
MALVNTTGDERGAELGHIIRNAYGFLRTGAVDLTRTTTGLLLEAVEAEGANRGTRVPAVTFLLKAAEKAGIEVSPRLRRRKYVRRPAVSASPVRRPAGSKGRSKLRSPYEVLMQEIYDPAKMKEGSAEERAVFTLARYLKSKKGKGSPGGAK